MNHSFPEIGCRHPAKFVINSIKAAFEENVSVWFAAYRLSPPGSYDYGTNNILSNIPLVVHQKTDLQEVREYLSLRKIVSNREIGVCSGIYVHTKNNPRELHIPMIDFIGRPSPSRLNEICGDLQTYLGDNPKYKIYDSGKSYHAYFATFIDRRKFNSFMGRLSVYPEVDRSWARIQADSLSGAVLRWSSITGEKHLIEEVRFSAHE